jgi:hypothetical protein
MVATCGSGQPISKIFVKTTLEINELVSVTASHELFEMVIDPLANLWAEAGDGTEYAYEMSDPVEEETFTVDGIEISDFLHPAWFEPFDHPQELNTIGRPPLIIVSDIGIDPFPFTLAP